MKIKTTEIEVWMTSICTQWPKKADFIAAIIQHGVIQFNGSVAKELFLNNRLTIKNKSHAGI